MKNIRNSRQIGASGFVAKIILKDILIQNRMKKLKFSKSNLNIWVETEEGNIKMIKVPIKRKMEFIKRFVCDNYLPKEMEVVEWLVKGKEGYYI